MLMTMKKRKEKEENLSSKIAVYFGSHFKSIIPTVGTKVSVPALLYPASNAAPVRSQLSVHGLQAFTGDSSTCLKHCHPVMPDLQVSQKDVLLPTTSKLPSVERVLALRADFPGVVCSMLQRCSF